jgi:predicted RNA-binding protein (virulence factor B family)
MNRRDSDFKEGQKVELLLCEPTDLGFKAIIEGENWGLIYNNGIFKKLERGQKTTGYIKKIREDGKIDLTLQKPGFSTNENLQEEIIEHLKNNNNKSHLNDKCSPEEIYQTFGVSKSQYKQALGMLYRQKKIKIEKSGITLL